ncbi:MAG TPA: serine/threonine-protein kinase [Xanthomonadaceae bacterium]|jgi:serine/threonine protein kinase/tetratricopeptide (TPR) repeat protein
MSDSNAPGHATIDIGSGAGVGDRIGPFKILQLLGEGGFGAVYEAEQSEPVKRRVALKIIKLGMDTREVIARFEAERQALALMDHPHIARVFDAGATETGRPYFVMELVKGEPITTYCARHLLSIPQRLQLFEQVCAAVQHAHTKGVIHRDLKPSNVLVSTQDNAAFAKVIDFGIAKATSGRLTERTLFTEANLMMGTPLYMSPEQAEGSADIDTRTDIYSLGVILYQLLTDSTPLDSNSLGAAAYGEVQRIIREVEPPRPSVRLSQSARKQLLGVDTRRGMDPGKLARIVRGELDWIVMKAIEKDRARRYDTASALSADVQRYLDGEPVLAAPPGTAYRLGKFVRRNKVPVVAGTLVALALLAGLVAFAWQAHIAREQERVAQQRASELRQVADFQAAMLEQMDPTRIGKSLSDDVMQKYAATLAKTKLSADERARDLEAFREQWEKVDAPGVVTGLIDRAILKPALAELDRKFKAQPLVDASLREALADSYGGIGLSDRAASLLQDVTATRRRLLGDDDRESLEAMENLGSALVAQDKPDAAEAWFRRTLAIRRRKLGADHPDTLESLSDLGASLDAQGKLKEAEPLLRDSLAKRQHALGADDPKTIESTSRLGGLLLDEGKSRLAEPLMRDALAGNRRVLGEDSPKTLGAINDVGAVMMMEGRPHDAEPYFREAWEKHKRLQGEDFPDTLQSLSNLGGVLMVEKKTAEAESVLREAVVKSRRVFGADDGTTLLATASLGKVLLDEGRFADAEQLLSPSEADARHVLADASPPQFGLFMLVLGKARAEQHEFAPAEAALLEADATFGKASGSRGGTFPLMTVRALADLYAAWDKADPGKGYAAKSVRWNAQWKKLDAEAAEKKRATSP